MGKLCIGCQTVGRLGMDLSNGVFAAAGESRGLATLSPRAALAGLTLMLFRSPRGQRRSARNRLCPPMPVSYTHLDVYKRQGHHRAVERADRAAGHRVVADPRLLQRLSLIHIWSFIKQCKKMVCILLEQTIFQPVKKGRVKRSFLI